MQTNILALLALAGASLAASPVGGGSWTKVSPSFDIQQCAGGKVSGNSFSIPKSPNGDTGGSGCSNGHLRAERRYRNNYSSGVHQFAGTFTINSKGGDRIAIQQTFDEDDGPYFIMAVKGSDLYSVEGGGTIASGVAGVGKKVTINTIHDVGQKKFTVYVNGVQKFSESAPSGNFYNKLGCYTTNSGTGPMSITWDDVAFWTR
ncbi:hypothetical protein VFPPC_16346 [Pochonia chlamydosporia 170]|uniref:Uncharacterized protein n=1 Tax=Pochonia chlamydosporia 170 TaxID=1380566 RepID=A0A179FJK4_METCM|nr:hypothetical protein VFPPC_16346 [Pochonia chlamydosporia 170]OAQ65430.1 hypothetical protein VFPPC_16346 [Pochonia chlamydosporia 170]